MDLYPDPPGQGRWHRKKEVPTLWYPPGHGRRSRSRYLRKRGHPYRYRQRSSAPVAGAAAAWLDAELVPLAASTVQDGKEWLVESRSALKLFGGLFLRSGKQGNLRWEGSPHEGTPSPSDSAPIFQSPAARVPAPQPSQAGDPVLSAIRWGSDEDKIRAVLDYEGPNAPEIQQGDGSVKVAFLLGKSGIPDLSSPHGEVNVSSVNFGDRVVLEFSSSLPLKEIIPLDGPPRIVIDFSSTRLLPRC